MTHFVSLTVGNSGEYFIGYLMICKICSQTQLQLVIEFVTSVLVDTGYPLDVVQSSICARIGAIYET